MKIFLDTDILPDFLGDRKPFSKFALEQFLNSHYKKVNLYISGNSITTAYYILSKLSSEKKARELVIDLMKQVKIVPLSENILTSAFRSEFNDVDAVQFYSALTIEEIRYIVTRNIKDYKKSTIPVLSSEEVLLKLK